MWKHFLKRKMEHGAKKGKFILSEERITLLYLQILSIPLLSSGWMNLTIPYLVERARREQCVIIASTYKCLQNLSWGATSQIDNNEWCIVRTKRSDVSTHKRFGFYCSLILLADDNPDLEKKKEENLYKYLFILRASPAYYCPEKCNPLKIVY